VCTRAGLADRVVVQAVSQGVDVDHDDFGRGGVGAGADASVQQRTQRKGGGVVVLG